jgi:hypothetical protein
MAFTVLRVWKMPHSFGAEPNAVERRKVTSGGMQPTHGLGSAEHGMIKCSEKGA